MASPSSSLHPHTPGPWETVGATRIWHTGQDAAAVCIVANPNVETSSDFREAWPQDEGWDVAMANAEFIVRACNNFGSLHWVARMVEADVQRGECCPICNQSPHGEGCGLVSALALAEATHA